MSAVPTSITIWNVNGIENTNMTDILQLKSDILCFCETKVGSKTSFPEIPSLVSKYPFCSSNLCQTRKRYSGTCIYSKYQPLRVFPCPEFDQEGRIIAQEYDTFVLVHVYTPNSGRDLKRLQYRINVWDKLFWAYVESLKYQKDKNGNCKEIIVCGDLNIIPDNTFIWKSNNKNAGCTHQERMSFKNHIKNMNMQLAYMPRIGQAPQYSFWSTFGTCREDNKGWLLDHFIVSSTAFIENYRFHPQIMGSDHCPITLNININ
jgi:exodeoxyribonuclease-3